MAEHDFLLPFLLERSAIRGRLVRLSDSVTKIINQHKYPQAVGNVLGQAVALAANLGMALKYEGVFTLQIKGKGAVDLLVADVTSEGALRSYARFDEARLGDEGSVLGEGTLVFTVDQIETNERYQGIVQLAQGEGLCAALQTYFKKSEQIPTGILVAARRAANGAWEAASLILQRMPREGGANAPDDTSIEDDWLRSMCLLQSCTQAELLDSSLPAEDLLFRLFHEEGVRIFDKKYFRHECRC
ncbi:MAG: Hsp33 family molecular chaperone HslO, partial [Bdellovibrionales bacterium]